MNTAPHRPLTVWLITDAKPGHRNQLAGLAERLQALAPAQCHWVSVQEHPVGWADWLLRRNPLPALPPPDWVVGAGHGTHRTVLFCKRLFKAATIVLMKPSLPVSWFDACIIPRHDKPPVASHVLATTGVLNTVHPVHSGRDAGRGLLLVGGTSTHFHWQSAGVVAQILRLCEAHPAIHWTLTNSRRTPEDFLPLLQEQALANLTVIPWQDTPDGWVKQQLEQAGQVWVTRDSVSMVFESITAAAPTGLLQLEVARESRVVNSMLDLIGMGWAQDFAAWDVQQRLPAPPQELWEADRAARWLLKRCRGV